MSKEESTELAARPLQSLVTFSSFDDLRAYAGEVAKSKFTPLKTAGDVLAAILTGQELGFKPMFSANNIHPVNGRSTLGVHAIAKILLENGIKIELLRDYEPCLNFVMAADEVGKDGKKVAYLQDTEGNEVKRDTEGKAPKGSTPIVLRLGFADEQELPHEVKGKKVICYKTVIKLTRKLKQLDGSYEPITATDSFSTLDALQADLLKKDNWKGYPRQMCYARALSLVAHKIADDLLGGLPETSEYADVKGIKYSVKEDGTVETEDAEAVDVTERKEEKEAENESSQSTVNEGEKVDTPSETDKEDSSTNNNQQT
jgi:hypothetical protein